MSAPHRNQSQRAPIGELGEPAAVKSTKMQGNGSRIVYSSAMSARDSSLTLKNDKGGMRQWLAHFGGSKPPPYEVGGMRYRIGYINTNAQSAYHRRRRYHAQSAYHARSAYHCAKRPCPRCHNLPADIVVPRRSIALSLNSLSLGYRCAKTRPRRVLCLLTLTQ